MKDIRKLGLVNYQQHIPQIVNKKSAEIIDYLCKQYPQTKIEAPNIALREEIPIIDMKGKIEYEFIRGSNVSFRYKKDNPDYAS